MRQSVFIIVIFFLATTLSCDKSGFGSIEGYVYDSFTGKAIAGAKVQMGYSGISKSDRWVKYTTTDNLGYYKISYFKKRSKDYLIFTNSDNYYNQSSGSVRSVDHRKTYHNMFLDPIAQVQFMVVNNTSTAANVIINLYPAETILVQPNSNTLSITQHNVNGNGETVFQWQLNVNGTYNNEKIEIHTGPSVVTHTIYIN